MTAPSAKPIRIMVVESQQLMREGLQMLFQGRSGFDLVAETGNGAESLVLADRVQPDIILLALDLGDGSGLDLLPDLLTHARKSRVLVLTGIRDPEMHRQAMLLGAMGVVQKENPCQVLFKAIEKVHAGEIWYDRSKIGSVFTEILRNENGRNVDPEAAKIASLTPREIEVIALISEGMKNRAIGERLFISETTVRHHLTAIFDKLGVSSRLELIIYAFSRGLAMLPRTLQHGSNGSVQRPLKTQK
jgi:two-component system, NarL family, nitrate/nitrite response regulator NarL